MEEIFELIQNEPLIFTFLITSITVFLVGVYLLINKNKIAPKETFPGRNKLLLPFSLVLIIASLAAFFVAAYFFEQKRQEGAAFVKAENFVENESRPLSVLQNEGFLASNKAGLYLVDVRSREEYGQEHIVGAINHPAKAAIIELWPIVGMDVAIYSDDRDEAFRVLRAARQNYEQNKHKYEEKPGKIYVIEEGFSGLKQAGLKTETGIDD